MIQIWRSIILAADRTPHHHGIKKRVGGRRSATESGGVRSDSHRDVLLPADARSAQTAGKSGRSTCAPRIILHLLNNVDTVDVIEKIVKESAKEPLRGVELSHYENRTGVSSASCMFAIGSCLPQTRTCHVYRRRYAAAPRLGGGMWGCQPRQSRGGM